MVEEEKGFVEDREIVIKEVELKVNRNNEQQVDKIIFHKTDGNITWKPKIHKESFEGGFKVSKQIPMERGLLPKKLIEMAMICSEQGQCKVTCSYNYWKTEQDGAEAVYRFITSTKTFEERWHIMKEETKEEPVTP